MSENLCDALNGYEIKKRAFFAKRVFLAKAQAKLIPPWMDDRSAEYLSLVEPWPDDFGEPEQVTSSQWALLHQRDDYALDTPERRIAYAFMARSAADCFFGKKAKRIKTIKELRAWLDKAQDFVYSFDYWADVIGLDESWAHKKWHTFLNEAEKCLNLNNDSIVIEGKVVPTRTFKLYRSRPISNKKRSKPGRKPIIHGQTQANNQQLNVGELGNLPDTSGITNLGHDGTGSGEPQTCGGSGSAYAVGTVDAG